jgi:hypothetical protein
MINQEKFFENPFSRAEVSPSRLYNFAKDSIGKFTAANTGAIYTAIIQSLTPLSNALGTEIGEVKSTLGVQKSSTYTVNEVIDSFKIYMSVNEGFIAKAVGGFKSAAYIEFYPRGVNEYTKATKTKMVGLLKQVFDAAAHHANQLGAATVTELQAFTTQYATARTDQETKKGSVADNRNDRTANRIALETGLLKAVYSVGLLYTGDAEKCGSFFNFSMLYAPSRGKKKQDAPPPVG